MLSSRFKPLAAQFGGIVFAIMLTRNGFIAPMGIFWLACIQGAFACILSTLLLAPRWWVPIHLGFLPAVVGAIALQLPASLYGSIFLLLTLIYWSTFRTQVPLFLSNRITVHRLAMALSDTAPLKVLDIGSGTGSFVLRLAKMRPDWHIVGIENAPAPYALSRWLSRHTDNLHIERGNFWQHSLASYDVVYAFLSPAPMTELWRKVRREMRGGSMLVSNSFAITDIAPDEIIDIQDRRGTQLYVYRIRTHKSEK